MKRKEFNQEMRKLHVELCKVQKWIKQSDMKIVVVFEGRDAAGKGGIIKCMTERVSPRTFRTVALPAPTDREKTQLYLQRYLQHFPAAGEILIFDRSWYNRAGVERVMGFCTEEQALRFLRICSLFEREIVESGITLIKYFLDVGQDEQERRFQGRIEDGRKHWKLSPMDIESMRLWWDYTQAYDDMIAATDTDYAPWYIVDSNDKRKARLNCISHFLSLVPYEEIPFEAPKLPKRKKRDPDTPKEIRAYIMCPHYTEHGVFRAAERMPARLIVTGPLSARRAVPASPRTAA
jgi:polyphosphate kinase 2